MATSENRFTLELNEKEVIELLENATPESIKKAKKYGMKIFQGDQHTQGHDVMMKRRDSNP
ncbi:uncharacterized protein LOC141865792 isoform X2 [Acropora palmata]|uniref:uncharacterized protein LOC141865792 isoform X2 n=1 Tax=Acropora palmata TaxID=6131 RepID=UPI003DA01D76